MLKFWSFASLLYMVILFFNHISAQWQTFLLSYLIAGDTGYTDWQLDYDPPINDTQYGIATGTVFTFTAGVAGLFTGYATDLFNRKYFLLIAALVWTTFTFLISFTHTYTQLLFCRLLFGVFQSACIPPSVSLIADYYAPDERGKAQAIYGAGLYLGVGMSSISAILDENIGWRSTIQIIGYINYAFALSVLLLSEPKRNLANVKEIVTRTNSVLDSAPLLENAGPDGNVNQSNPVSQAAEQQDQEIEQMRQTLNNQNPDLDKFWPKMKMLFTNKCYVYLLCASFFRFWGGYSLGFLGSKYFENVYPDYTTAYAWQNAFVVIVGGLSASVCGGYLADKYEYTYPRIKGYIGAIGALVSVPFICITFFWQQSYYTSIISYFFAYFTAECWYGPSHALINNLFPSQAQGISIAFFQIAGTISGSIATAIMSVIATAWNAEDYPAREGYVVGLGVLFSYLGCAPFFFLAGNEYEKFIKEQRAVQRRGSIQMGSNEVNLNLTSTTSDPQNQKLKDSENNY